MCPIVVLALAPCQWRSPALMCTTSPTLISRCSCSVATMPEPEVTTRIWSQLGVPARRATLAEIYDAAVVVRGIAGLDDGLTRPGNRAGPAFDPLGAFDWDVRDVFERDDLHVTVSS